MKKEADVSSKSASTPACAMKICISDSSRGQQNAKGLGIQLNRKTRNFQELESSKSSKPSKATTRSDKSSLQRITSLDESLSKYKIENMAPRELHESLARVKEEPVQPFMFLSNILDARSSDVHVSIERNKPTEIDLQLAALKRRVEHNKSLLERTNEHAKEINFLMEKNSMIAFRELNYNDE